MVTITIIALIYVIVTLIRLKKKNGDYNLFGDGVSMLTTLFGLLGIIHLCLLALVLILNYLP
jgi:hypothetical protein